MGTTLGFVTVPRLEADLLGDELDIAQTHRGAWLWLFDKAAWKGQVARFGRFSVQLKRGEIACSYRFLARAWNWSHGRVQRWLKLLADRGKITLRVEGGVVVIALAGYFRGESNPESQKAPQAAAFRPVDDQQPSQKEKKESQEGGRRARGARTTPQSNFLMSFRGGRSYGRRKSPVEKLFEGFAAAAGCFDLGSGSAFDEPLLDTGRSGGSQAGAGRGLA